MANTSIGGLVSGLDTATIISQLMQLEAQPQTRLKSRVTSEQSALTALQALNTKLAALATKAGDLSKDASWAAATATSSSEHVTATAATSTPGTFGFTVNQRAAATKATYATIGGAGVTGLVTSGTKFDVLSPEGAVIGFFDSGDGSLTSVAAAINSADLGLTAGLVRVGTDGSGAATYRLSVTSQETGADTGFSVVPQSNHADTTAFLGGTATYAPGQNAEITMSGETGRLTSPTNTFEDLMPGVDITLGVGAKTDDVVTVTVAPDAQALSDKVKALVDAVNAAVSDIDTLTNYNAATKKGGLLGGDTVLRSVRDQLVSSVISGVDGTSLATVGIEVDRSGKLTFDADEFKAAYVASPAETIDKFAAGTPAGVASSLEGLAKKFSNSVDGVVTSLVKGRTSAIDGLNDAIEGWDARLAVKRSALERQYGALEVALGKLQSQSSWLAGQISSLPQMSSGS